MKQASSESILVQLVVGLWVVAVVLAHYAYQVSHLLLGGR